MGPQPSSIQQPPPSTGIIPGVMFQSPSFCKITLMVGEQKFVGTGRTVQSAKHDAASRALQVLKTQLTNKMNEVFNCGSEDGDSKSPISQVHEIGLKRNMSVLFKVLREDGPAHMRNFVTECTVGSISVIFFKY